MGSMIVLTVREASAFTCVMHEALACFWACMLAKSTRRNYEVEWTLISNQRSGLPPSARLSLTPCRGPCAFRRGPLETAKKHKPGWRGLHF